MTRNSTTVCQVLHTLNVGGAEVLACRLARGLADSFRFVFVCLDELGTLGREMREEGFPVAILGRRSGLDWGCAWRLGRFLRGQRVDLVHAHQYTPFFYALMARMSYRRPPVLFTEHGRHFPDYPRRKRLWANRLLLERRDRVVGVGQSVRQALIDNEGFPPERVDVVYNGISLAAKTSSGDRQGVRAELGLEDDTPLILQVARLDYLKDHATAVRAMAEVVRQYPQARLVLVGEGPERKAIEDLIASMGLRDRVQLLGLRLDVSRLLAGADLFLLSSISEGIPLTIIEAMAAGLPVVATRVGGVPEVVEDGRTGLLAPAGDPVALGAGILKLLTAPARRREMALRGQDRALHEFSEPNMIAAYEKLYRRMLPAQHGKITTTAASVLG